jgi:hypothetical protein
MVSLISPPVAIFMSSGAKHASKYRCDLGGARYHFMARNTSERFQEWNGMQRK